MPVTPISSQEEQDKLLDIALTQVKQHGFSMKTSLDSSQLMDALKHASTMLLELRTSLLTPRNYYELYMAVCDQLTHLEQFLLVDFHKNKVFKNLYEVVQYVNNIVPRLYLLVTVGTVYMKTKEASRKDILKDLVEMCRGVQAPLRGLFLRNYLLQSTRNQLLDIDNIESVEEGSVEDSVAFVLQNFAEMNKLWVRMQHQGHSREKAKREKERLELKILVGTNLVRLSELDGVDAAMYQKTVLPNVLEQVVKCRDPIAQEYLMECIIQVFPEDFHLATLNLFLKACSELDPTVNVKDIIIALINRFVEYARREDSAGIPTNIQLFDIFSQEVAMVIQSRTDMSPEDIVSLQLALVELALRVYTDKIHYVDKVLQHTVDIFNGRDITSVDSTSAAGQKLTAMLRNITEAYKETLTLLQLEAFPAAVALFRFKGRKAIALNITETLLDNGVMVPSVEQAEQILQLLAPLMCDQPDQPEEVPDADTFTMEQEMVARLVHHFKVDVPDQQYAMLNSARKQFAAGGEGRMRFTLPPVVFASYQLIFRYHAMGEEDDRWQRKCEKILEFCIKTITALAKVIPDLSLRLFLQGALAADRIGLEKEAYEFISQAFTVFEEDISDSKEQMCALLLIVATFERMQSLGEENHETLRTNCTRSATSLLKKPDQCRTVATCAHLFWSGRVKGENGEPGVECHDGKRVAECLKRCGRITGQCMDTTVQVQLLIEVLNFYILFYEKGNSQVTPSFLKQLIDKIKMESANLEATEEMAQIKQHFQNTLAHIEYRQRLKAEGASYEGLVV